MPSPWIRAHGSPLPAAGVVHSTSGPVPACCAGPPICSKQTPPFAHAHPALPLADPDPEPDPDPELDPWQTPDGQYEPSFGHGRPYAYQLQPDCATQSG